MERIQDDVIIIGGGIAGIVASIELLAAGRRVTLLDRDQEENFGGQAKESFGGIFAVGSDEQRRAGVKDSPEQAWQDWCSFAEFKEEDDWPQRWAKAFVHDSHAEVYRWLKARGIRFLPLPGWVERGLQRPGNTVPRFHVIWGTGQYLITRLLAELNELSGLSRLSDQPHQTALRLKFNHRIDGLITDAGRIVGCHGQHESTGHGFEARGETIVIASGGINGDLARVRRHWHGDWGQPPDLLLNGGHRYADGRLHDAVVAATGCVTHLERMWNYAAGVHHWRPRVPHHGLSLVPPRSALWLNWRGERFQPPLVSGFDTRDLVARICHEQRAYSWQLLNRRIALRELAISGAEFNHAIRNRRVLAFMRELAFGNRHMLDELIRACPDVVIADTLPELVARMNALQGDDAVDFERLDTTVRAYDAALDQDDPENHDPQLRQLAELRRWRPERQRTCRRQKIIDHKALPLMAIREFIISRKTLGGIRTDLDGRVLNAADQPLQGLYAIGEAAGFGGGGMHGLRALEGSFLGGCIYSARRTARAIAQGV
ncbi:MAG: FAD-binding dehydrogenase [Sterolibacterium sp.]|nr:FAD-binding dehydrogenase [Sterolibacterium sp.]